MRWSAARPGGSLATTSTDGEGGDAATSRAAPVVCDHHRGQHPSEPLNSHEERTLVMPHEPSGSCPPIQQAPAKRCPACGRLRPLAEFPMSPAGRCAACCSGCRRAAARLASRRRAAAMRLLIAFHPEEWAGLIALVSGRGQLAATRRREVA